MSHDLPPDDPHHECVAEIHKLQESQAALVLLIEEASAFEWDIGSCVVTQPPEVAGQEFHPSTKMMRGIFGQLRTWMRTKWDEYLPIAKEFISAKHNAVYRASQAVKLLRETVKLCACEGTGFALRCSCRDPNCTAPKKECVNPPCVAARRFLSLYGETI